MAEMLTKPWRKGGLPVAASPLTAGLFAVVLVACLYVGREVLVPIALAVLMSFVLAPLVRLLQNWYVPRGLAVVVVVRETVEKILAVATRPPHEGSPDRDLEANDIPVAAHG
jgi:hypothetical protein